MRKIGPVFPKFLNFLHNYSLFHRIILFNRKNDVFGLPFHVKLKRNKQFDSRCGLFDSRCGLSTGSIQAVDALNKQLMHLGPKKTGKTQKKSWRGYNLQLLRDSFF